jgi:hypothetical protein
MAGDIRHVLVIEDDLETVALLAASQADNAIGRCQNMIQA